MSDTVKLTLAHSPDSDDAFIFWALAKGRVKGRGIEFEHILSDIQTLNQAALESRYDVTAISLHAYPYINHEYSLLNVGASVGDGYGPTVVSRERLAVDDLPGMTIAIPGSLTTAALVLRLAFAGIRTEEMSFDHIIEAVKKGKVRAGLIIHEGQITYRDEGLHRVIDLGGWWREETGLPLPLGANAIRRTLGGDVAREVAGAIRASIMYAMSNRAEALAYARDFGRDLGERRVDEFVSMYVNDFTVDWGDTGRAAVAELLRRGAEAGIVPAIDRIDFLG